MKNPNPQDLKTTQLLGEDALIIRNTQEMAPFLMHMITDSDVWAFIGSNHAVCAGRKNPDHSLFPYYTQDKLFDTVNSSGSLTIVSTTDPETGEQRFWHPFSSQLVTRNTIERHVIKSVSGTKIALEEVNKDLNLKIRVTWTSSKSLGIIRHTQIFNESGNTCELEVLDGIQNVMPSGIDQLFQNTFSNLADAYKQSEWTDNNVALYALSSIPTDKAEPNECLTATVVYSCDFPISNHFLTANGIRSFTHGTEAKTEFINRGTRGNYLLKGNFELAPDESKDWWTMADMEQSAAQIIDLQQRLTDTADLPALIKEEVNKTALELNTMVERLDGVQITNQKKDSWRHFSNTLFNMMRGGTFLNEYRVPTTDLVGLIKTRNREVAFKFEDWLANLPEELTIDQLKVQAKTTENSDLIRLINEYLPLSFSRRHGDPSRPWNRFNIDVTTDNGDNRYAYQGNWRDIFQNWEALLYAFPQYSGAAISRFLNTTTFDGYNPYRITQDGFDWEREEPDSPWSNIGYWGDHQIVYLLKLLELSHKTNPQNLLDKLATKDYAYAAVPYRIKSIDEIIENARDSIVYDLKWSDQIDVRATELGTDGQLLSDTNGDIIYANLAEKLLVPLLAKMSNFVPDAGIWMNTQRPEWNDANNALAGYGASVVTTGYVLRYIRFLIELFEETTDNQTLELHHTVDELLNAIASALPVALPNGKTDASTRGNITRTLGEAGTKFRNDYYNNGVSSEFTETKTSKIVEALKRFQINIEKTLETNEREDSLYHSYNLLRFSTNGDIEIEHLCLMLEGQVSILSSGTVNTDKALSLLEALHNSELYRADQNSYLLYPNRELSGLVNKGIIDTTTIEQDSFLGNELNHSDSSYIEKAPDGTIRFKGHFHNLSALNTQLANDQLEPAAKTQIRNVYESTFNHHAFTGRSRSFFAFEGLGSIYWHMVSKLLLAVQEIIIDTETKETPEKIAELTKWYFEIKDGIGVDKTPENYGAFPTDPYSHTPAHAGAQQPGMTGQVKEDFISRQHELGLRIQNGCISFAPSFIRSSEFLESATTWTRDGTIENEKRIELPANSLGFTVCNTPVVFKSTNDEKTSLKIITATGETIQDKLTLTAEDSQNVFQRNGVIQRIEVSVPQQ